jgi:MoxR-like ATPase
MGLITEVFTASQTEPILLLVDELDKANSSIDSFFLSPLQESKIVLSDGTEILANPKNLLVIFTKNFERKIDDALLRRVQPISMEYLDTSLERRILSEHCAPQLIQNLIKVADKMRKGDEAYPFERPPAPEEILRAGKSVARLLSWNIKDNNFIGQTAFHTLAKSANDKVTLEGLIKHHNDFYDPLFPDPKKMTKRDTFSRMGSFLLQGITEDPEAEARAQVYKPKQKDFLNPGTPEDLASELSKVGYQCLPYLAIQLSLLLSTKSDSVRTLLLEGPSGCGKSYLAKCLSRIFAAEFMCLSCYQDMETKHLIEYPSTLALAKAQAAGGHAGKDDLLTLGLLSRAFLKSQTQPTILLIDEIDKVDNHIDTFFLGPLQDGRIWLESRPPIDANIDNLLVIFTKNNNRILDQALLRRLVPVSMQYLDATLERKILSKSCSPQLVSNLVSVAERMRRSDGTYQFERPPAPEELLTAGNYVSQMLDWGENDFSTIGRSVWGLLAKSEHDRAVFEHMLRYHPDFEDPLVSDNKSAPLSEIEKRLGRWVLQGIIDDPERDRREQAWNSLGVN